MYTESRFDRAALCAGMVVAFVIAAWEYARAISLVVYMFMVELKALGDMWNIFIYLEVGICLFAGVLYTIMGSPDEGVLQVSGLFSWTPFVIMLTSLSIWTLRYSLADTTCPECPTYVTSGVPNCHKNPYAVGATLDWTSFDTYDRDLIINNTLEYNPSSDIRDQKILDNIERCWTIGCSECTNTYEWRPLLTLGTWIDIGVNFAFGIFLVGLRSRSFR